MFGLLRVRSTLFVQSNLWRCLNHLVFTGASSALGYRLCRSVLARGDLVVAVAASQQGLDSLRSTGACTIQIDSDMRFSQMKSKIRDAVSVYGQIDIVVNNPDHDSPLESSGYVFVGGQYLACYSLKHLGPAVHMVPLTRTTQIHSHTQQSR